MDTDTGASRFWTDGDPRVAAARTLVVAGELEKADAALAPLACELPAADEGRQVIRWIRRDYGLSPDAMLARLRGQVRDVSADDIERWRARGELQHRLLDGKPAYFRSEPANLFRFCEEAKSRRLAPPPEPGWKLHDHLARVISDAEKLQRPDVVPMRHRVTHSITVKREPLKPGCAVRAWLPFPRVYRQQHKAYLVATTPGDGQVSAEDSPHRSVYFERKVDDVAAPCSFAVTFEYATSAWYPALSDAAATEAAAKQGAAKEGAAKEGAGPNFQTPNDLSDRPPHILFSQSLKAAVAEAVGDERNPLARARKIFEWVDGHIAYNAEEEYGIVPALADKALFTRRGDCGVQGMLFIAMCRCAGIPARWQSGFQTRRDRHNMHDWAEFHVAPWGWLPADPSYGLQQHDDPRIRHFYFGHTDSYRLIINSDYGRPLRPAKRSVRSEPLDFQRGEVEIDGRNVYFDGWSWDFAVKWLDEGP